jgi:WD repeat-containing protein 23
MRFNSDGSEIVAGSTDRHLYIYSRELNKCVLALPAHEEDINAVCFGDRDSHIILSAGDDGLCKVWDRRVMGEYGGVRPVGTFAGHRDGITFIDSRGDDRYLLTNSKDQTIKLWDMRCFASNEAIEATKKSVSVQKWDYRWQCCPPENYNSSPLPGDASVLTLRGHSVLHTLVRARFSPEHTGKRFVYTGCARGGCRDHDIFTGDTVKVYDGHRGVVRDCMWHPLYNEIVTTSWDGETSVWRYDERAARNINPESSSGVIGDEDSCDERYEPTENFKIRRCRPGGGPISSRTRNSLRRSDLLKTDDESEDDEMDLEAE